jgi:hypothetical protein
LSDTAQDYPDESDQGVLGSSIGILTVPAHMGSGRTAGYDTDLDLPVSRIPKLGGFSLK